MQKFLDKKVAIVGMACRFPGGADNPQKFWELLTAGKNVVSDIPAERWQANRFFNDNTAASAKSYVQKAHFIDWDYKCFDAGFFNFAPREVEYFDPQQRLMLEVSWEAMENAGLDVAALAGSKTGVYVGGFTLDHMLNQMGSSARSEIGAHSAAGATLTMLSNRLSYAYDFRGPSISVDTACSSSLVAFSYAVSDIRNGAASMALVGGVNMMLRPEYPIAMSKGQFLARDGRSKSFDARADGYGRGEGAGLVILKSLKAALDDGDRILAVVEGAGVNQDGRTSGITVPNANSQRALMESVVEEAAIDPRSVQYVEAHGTGTPVGDPLEASAISAVYGANRDTACRLGSLKSNIGHLEAAAGVAAVIKACLMLNANKVPVIAGLEQPNPGIPFGDNGLELATELTDLAREGDTRRVAINSFGYGGTNAHAILARCPDLEWLDARRSGERPQVAALLPLSAQDGHALQQFAQRCAGHLRDTDQSLEDILYTLSRRRTHLGHRLAVWGDSREQLAQSLEAFARDGMAENACSGVRPFTGNTAPVFVFTGMGPQWWGMGQDLYRTNVAYRSAVDEADAIFQDIAGFSIRDEMLKPEADSRITETAIAQPANFVIQYALTRTLEAQGLTPSAVVGHSVGEITSAWAAGSLSLHDALLVACERSRIQAKAAGQGSMLAVGLGFDEAIEAIGNYADKVSVAAVNSPSSITLAGDEVCLERLREALEARDIFARALTVEVPYHSPMMEPLKPELMEKLGSLTPSAPTVPLYSTVTGKRVDDERYNAAYWCRNVREPVFFAKTIESMLDDGYRMFVEVGPHPVLRSALKETFTAHGADARSVQTLNRKQDELAALSASLADVFAQGGELDWSARHPVGQLVSLPNYPWQRQHLWREAESQRRDRTADVDRPLLGVREPGTTTWRADLADYRLNYLVEHVVDGMSIMPAAGYIETMLEAIVGNADAASCRLSNIAIDKALILDSSEPRFTSLSLTADGSRMELHCVDERKPDNRALHAAARVYPLVGKTADNAADLLDAEQLTLSRSKADVYEGFAAFSMQYGPLFQPISHLRLDEGRTEVLARLELPEALKAGAGEYIAHPSLLDGCLQTVLSLLKPDDGAFLPTLIRDLRIHQTLPHAMWCHGKLTQRNSRTVECDLTLINDAGEVLATLRGLVCSALQLQRRGHSYPAGDLKYTWSQEPLAAAKPINQHWLVVSSDDAWPTGPLLERLSKGGNTRFVSLQDDDAADVLATAQCDAVAFLAGCGFSDEDDVCGEAAAQHLLQTMQRLGGRDKVPRLYTITRNAFQVTNDDAPPIPAQGALAGLTRVAFNELGHADGSLRATTIDLPRIVDNKLVETLVDELQANDDKDEVALRLTGRYFSQIGPSGIFAEMAVATVNPAQGQRFELRRNRENNNFTIATSLPERLGSGDIELAIEAIGIDADAALEVSGGGDEEPKLMSVCARVSRVGTARLDLRVGDRMAGFVPASMASHLRVDESQSLLVPVDAALCAREVAGCAVPSALAQRLADAAMLGAGDRAVVCATAEGKALARILSDCNVEIHTLPGKPGEWTNAELDAATASGVITAIAAPLAAWEQAFGFDALAAGGCLIDLDTGFAPLKSASQAGRLVRIDPAREISRNADRLTAALIKALEDAGPTVTAIEHQGLDTLVQQPADALAGAGQLVLDMQPDIELAAQASDNPRIREDAAYLVTGGFGGLGKETARWLLRHGAGHVALCGRRAGTSESDQAFLAELADKGFSVSAHPCDLADLDRVRDLVDALATAQTPLRGVFHTAGLLEDKPLLDMTADDMARVMKPKALGAWHLHLATAEVPLDHFVLYSSISVLVGNSNQANYCAANGFLDSLAHFRRAHGQAAMSLNWGAIDTVGMLSQDEAIGRHLRQIGLVPIPFDEALNGMARAMSLNETQVCIASNPDWKKWASYESHGGHSPRFRNVVTQAREQADDSVQARLRKQLNALDTDQRFEVLSGLIAEIFARELKTPADQIDPAMPLDFLGVDSLMATEIRVKLDSVLGLSISELELADNGSIAGLANKWHEQMDLDQTAGAAA